MQWKPIRAGVLACLAGLIFFSGCASSKKAASPAGEIKGLTSDQPGTRVQTFDAAWQIIQNTHWDTNFNGVNWAEIRAELRPKAEAAANVAELRQVIEEMLRRLEQSHMALFPGEIADAFDPKAVTERKSPDLDKNTANDSSSRIDGDVGFDVRWIDGQIVVFRVEPDGPAERAGVKPGWIVRKIGSESLDQRLNTLPAELASRQAQFMAWRIVKALLTGKTASVVPIEFLDGRDQPITVNVRRQRQTGEPVKFGLLPTLYARFESERLKAPGARTVGLIRFNYWMIPIASAFDKAVDEFRGADGMVIDLRGNLGGLGGMIMGLSGHFLKEPASLGIMKLRGNSINFFANPRLVNGAGERVEPFAGPFAILVDEVSLSAAEIFAGGLQDIGRARVFGETSGGQALPAVWDRLPNGDVLYHAIADFTTASGIRLETRGVIPDVRLPLVRKDLLANQDVPLQSALAWIADEQAKKRAFGDKAGTPKEQPEAR